MSDHEKMSDPKAQGTILLAGANRGLGLGLVKAYLARGWHVIATARQPEQAAELAALHAAHPDQLRVEPLDVADAGSRAALAAKLAGAKLDVVFVVAGMSGHFQTPFQDVPPEDVSREFLTNSFAPIVLAEALLPAAAPGATIAFMTSLLGSIGSNAGGGMDLYRASKAALNMLGSCFALRHKDMPVLLLHPGWVRTDMGGANAPLDVETSVHGLVEVLSARAGKAGVAYLDYKGQTLPW